MFEKMLSWSKKEYKDLPWRINRSLYSTLVSEIMLQQTTVSTVLNYFSNFMRKYPTIERLAKISEEQILIDWKGLGYYRRARNLLNAAKQIVEKYNGVIPLDYDSLVNVKGIGDYTAKAILSIGANEKALAIDANLERVLSRFYGIKDEKGTKLVTEIKKKFDEGSILKELSENQFGAFHEGIMDVGRVFCKANKVICDKCPLSENCTALKVGEQLKYPYQKEKLQTKFYELHLIRFVVFSENKVLAYRKNKTQWLSGQYELPTFCIYSEDIKFKQYPFLDCIFDLDKAITIKSSITKYKIKNYIVSIDGPQFEHILSIYNIKLKYVFLKDFKKLGNTCLKVLKKERLI